MEQPIFHIMDEHIEKVLENLDSENGMKEAIKTLLLVTADTRRFLRQVHKELGNVQKVYGLPTSNPEDIICGLVKQGVISEEAKKKMYMPKNLI